MDTSTTPPAGLHDDWMPRLQAVCDQYDVSMRGHYEWLSRQVTQFHADKAALVEALRREGSSFQAPDEDSVKGLLPASLRQLLALVAVADDPVECQEPLHRPLCQPGNGKRHIMKPKRRIKAEPTQVTSISQIPPQNAPRPRLTPTLPPISAWEVEAAEYVFEYAPFGLGWFVLRCARGECQFPVNFEAHPLGAHGLGMAHFRDSACEYHRHDDEYTEEAMMVAYARRVEDADGDDVTAQWAAASNEHLAEMIERRAVKETRRKQRRQSRQGQQGQQGRQGQQEQELGQQAPVVMDTETVWISDTLHHIKAESDSSFSLSEIPSAQHKDIFADMMLKSHKKKAQNESAKTRKATCIGSGKSHADLAHKREKKKAIKTEAAKTAGVKAANGHRTWRPMQASHRDSPVYIVISDD